MLILYHRTKWLFILLLFSSELKLLLERGLSKSVVKINGRIIDKKLKNVIIVMFIKKKKQNW